MNLNFFKKIYNEDIIYHYTKASTAINFILYNNQLRFSKRKKSIDPIESKMAQRRTIFYNAGNDDGKIKYDSYGLSDKLATEIRKLEELFCQICFCKNTLGSDFASENYHTQFNGNEELFGFTKPRMWERYADNYHGTCLAFSKKKLIKRNKDNYNLIYQDVEYLKYAELAERKIDYISGNYVNNAGYDKYKVELEKIVESSFFCKHIDYSGENEFRMGVYHDPDKCEVEKIRGEFQFFETMMLDFNECLEAIFVSSFANERQKEMLLKYANKFNVPIIEMEWKHNSFKALDYRESKKMFK